MGFKTTLGKALTRTDILTLMEECGLAAFEHDIRHRFVGQIDVTLEDEKGDQYGPFALAQEIEVDDEGKSSIVTIPEDEGDEPTMFTVYFERTVPLNMSHLEK